MNDPAPLIARVEALSGEQIRTVIEQRTSRWENRNAIMMRAHSIGHLISRRIVKQATLDADNAALRVARKAGLRDASDISIVQAATRELVVAFLVKEQIAAHEYLALVRCWQAVIPEFTDAKGAGELFMSQEVQMAQETEERARHAAATQPKPKPKRETRKAGEPRKLREAAAVSERKLLGDPTNGVRVKPSKDHPGMFFLIEGRANRRVYSGYIKTQEEAEKIIKKQGWRSLGLVGQREPAERPTVRQGGKADQSKEQVREEQRQEEKEEAREKENVG